MFTRGMVSCALTLDQAPCKNSRKRGHYERGRFGGGSLESPENGHILLYFPYSGSSLESPASLNSLESPANEYFDWEFPNLVVCNFYAESLLFKFAPFCALLHSFEDLRLRPFALICEFCVQLRLEPPRLGTAEKTPFPKDPFSNLEIGPGPLQERPSLGSPHPSSLESPNLLK